VAVTSTAPALPLTVAGIDAELALRTRELRRAADLEDRLRVVALRGRVDRLLEQRQRLLGGPEVRAAWNTAT
jgi:hypothetical protein